MRILHCSIYAIMVLGTSVQISNGQPQGYAEEMQRTQPVQITHAQDPYIRDVKCEDILRIGFLDPTKPIDDDRNLTQIVYNSLYHLPKDTDVDVGINLDGILKKLASISIDSKVDISKEAIKGNIQILESLIRSHKDVREKIVTAIKENNMQIVDIWSNCQKNINTRQSPTTLTWVDWTKNEGKNALALKLLVDKPRQGYQYCAEVTSKNATIAATIPADAVCKGKGIGLGNNSDSNTLLFTQKRKDSTVVLQISVSERSVSRDKFSPVPELRRTLILPALSNEAQDQVTLHQYKSLEYVFSQKRSKEQIYSMSGLRKSEKIAIKALSIGWNLAAVPRYEEGIFPYSSKIAKNAPNGAFEIFSINPISFDKQTNQLRFTTLAQNNFYVACERDSSGRLRLAASSNYPHTVPVPTGPSASPIVFIAEPANNIDGRLIRIRSSLYMAGAVKIRDYVSPVKKVNKDLNPGDEGKIEPGYYPPLDCNSTSTPDSSATFEFQVIEDIH